MSSSVTVAEAGPESAAEWDRFVANSAGASIYHRYFWRDLMEAEFGCRTWYLAARDADGVLRGVLPLVGLKSLLFGHYLVSVPWFNYGGVLADDAAADEALMAAAGELAGRLGASHVEFRETRPREGRPARTDKVAMVLELAPTADAQWSALGSKLRAQVRRPEKEGAVTTFGGAELVPDFYRVFARNMRDLGTPVYARSLFERVLAAPGAGAEIGLVSLGGRPVAAGLVLHHGEVTEIPWASSLREWNKVGVNMLLYWEILKRAIARGSRRFDFGRSTAGGGTYRFKAQWGARPVQLHWHYWLAPGREMPRLNPDNPKYELAIRMWRQMPVWAANIIGPRIVRALP
jgi:serine/alanine adding enzyme